MRTYPASLTAALAARAPSIVRVHLLEVQRADGANFFWSTHEGIFPSVITGANQTFKPWLKGGQNGPTLKLTRSLTADFGELRVQNLSGNTIDRDVAGIFSAQEFEGAYCVFRRWFLPLDVAGFEFHGFASEPQVDDNELVIRQVRLFQPNELSAYEFNQTLDCHWRFGSAQCGYRRGTIFVPLSVASSFSANTIGTSGLTLVPDLYKDELVVITHGTGAGQERYILSHTSNTFTVKTNWTTVPDSSSIYVVEGPGTPKVARTAAIIFSSNTIGNGSLARTVNGDTDALVVLLEGLGAGQFRRIVSNTATTFTVSPAWNTTPDGSTIFEVVFRDCPKDRASCVARGVPERFSGIIQLQSQVTQTPGNSGARPGGGGGSGTGGIVRPPVRIKVN